MVFSTVVCLNYRFVFMSDYFLYMSGNTPTGSMSIGNRLNPTPPGPPPGGPSGPSTTMLPPPANSNQENTSSETVMNTGYATIGETLQPVDGKLVYTKVGEKDYIRFVDDHDGAKIGRLKRGAFVNCMVESIDIKFSRPMVALNLANCTDKAPCTDFKAPGICIPDVRNPGDSINNLHGDPLGKDDRGRIIVLGRIPKGKTNPTYELSYR
ncbi:MAG: hypothetical protein EOP34_02695 [Rickettsiales bacterium]|nr:MAG: hypothetical protein EOP34_02695 [Rickettsiales bacterium]